MANAKTALSTGIKIADQFYKTIFFFFPSRRKKLFSGSNAISIEATIINLERLRGVAKNFSKNMSSRALADDEIFKPSNVDVDRVSELIDVVLSEIKSTKSLSPLELEKVENYLKEAKRDVGSENPPWSKIVGALLIVAALISGLADAPGAAKTVGEAIEYILGTSVARPLQRYLPPPSEKPFVAPPFRDVA